MICSQDDAPCSHINPRKIQEHIEHCNLAWILFIKRIAVTFVVADGPLTSSNQTCASILAAVYVLLGTAVTEYKWGGSRNILFMRHKFLVLTVKKLLKSVYIYGSYRKIKTGVGLSLFLDHPVKLSEVSTAFSHLCSVHEVTSVALRSPPILHYMALCILMAGTVALMHNVMDHTSSTGCHNLPSFYNGVKLYCLATVLLS